MSHEFHVTILGAPRTKKTHNQVVTHSGRIRVLPSKSWRDWCARACIKLGPGFGIILTTPMNCRAIFYRDANRGDAVGYYQGLADLLEKRGVIVNDRLIESWDGSRLLKDAENPRVEIVLTPV